MKSICLYFQIHQPFRLKRYRFFNIGADHHYFDDANNEAIIKRIAKNSYIPANNAMLQMIKESNGEFKVAYSISGLAVLSFLPKHTHTLSHRFAKRIKNLRNR